MIVHNATASLSCTRAHSKTLGGIRLFAYVCPVLHRCIGCWDDSYARALSLPPVSVSAILSPVILSVKITRLGTKCAILGGNEKVKLACFYFPICSAKVFTDFLFDHKIVPYCKHQFAIRHRSEEIKRILSAGFRCTPQYNMYGCCAL